MPKTLMIFDDELVAAVAERHKVAVVHHNSALTPL
jgi:hypothetical protein